MVGDRARRSDQYLRELRDEDLAFLAASTPKFSGIANPAALIRSEPEQIEMLLEQPAAFEAVFGSVEDPHALHLASPFLLFAVAVYRTADELERANYVTEWFGPRQRMPVLKPPLCGFKVPLYPFNLLKRSAVSGYLRKPPLDFSIPAQTGDVIVDLHLLSTPFRRRRVG